MFGLNLGLFAKMRQNDVRKRKAFFGSAPGQKRSRDTSRARAEGEREKSFAILRLRISVFGLNLALYRKMWQNDTHKKDLLCAALATKNDKKTGLERAPKALARKIWRF